MGVERGGKRFPYINSTRRQKRLDDDGGGGGLPRRSSFWAERIRSTCYQFRKTARELMAYGGDNFLLKGGEEAEAM